jgi:hypothetical protein
MVGSPNLHLSARARRVGGIVDAELLAVCALTTNSSFVALGYAQLHIGYRNFSRMIGGLTKDAARHRIQFGIGECAVIFVLRDMIGYTEVKSAHDFSLLTDIK